MSVRVVLSSSRNPSVRTRQFINEFEYSTPNTKKINRGRMSITDLITKVIELDAKYLIYIVTRKGNPSALKFTEVGETFYKTLPYVVKIFSIKLLIDMPVRRIRKAKARTAIIIMLKEYNIIGDIFSQILNIPVITVNNLENLRKTYDVLIITKNIYGKEWRYEIHYIDGDDFGPSGPVIKISDIKYVRSEVINV